MGNLSGAFKRAAVWVISTVLALSPMAPAVAADLNVKGGLSSGCAHSTAGATAKQNLLDAINEQGMGSAVHGYTPGGSKHLIVFVNYNAPLKGAPGFYKGGYYVRIDEKNHGDACILDALTQVYTQPLSGRPNGYIPATFNTGQLGANLRALDQNSNWTLMVGARTEAGTLLAFAGNSSEKSGVLYNTDGAGSNGDKQPVDLEYTAAILNLAAGKRLAGIEEPKFQ